MKQVKNERYHENYQETVLDNGLHVVLWHKPGYEKSLFMMVTPFGAVDLCQLQNDKTVTHPSGIAHFLEHKMFATKDDDVMNLFSQMGANVNAFTSYQETAYYASTSGDPKEPLSLLLDFVQELVIDDASVEKEKGIILSELHMYREMSDQRLLMETYESLFQKHPLRYDIAGDDDSVSNTTVSQLYRCYEMNYHPANMLLICISGHDPKELFAVIESNQAKKQFPAWEKSKTIHETEPKEVARKDFSFTMDVSVPKLCVAYKLEGISDAYERLRCEWAIRFLLDAQFSSLNPQYQEWLDQKIISDFSGCDIELGKDYGILMFYSESEQPEAFIQLCESCMDEIMKGTICDALLEQLKKRYYAQSVRSMNSFDDIAIGFARSYFMGVDYFDTLSLIDDLTKQDVLKATAKLDKEHRAVVRLLPKQK